MPYRAPHIASSDITPEPLYLKRRELMALGAAAALTRHAHAAEPSGEVLPGVKPGAFKVDEKPTSWDDVTTYNNFYEFGTGKSDPAEYAGKLTTRPWTVAFDGEIKKPFTMGIEDILKAFPLEERVYRFRCVEAWSMVIPWVGFPLADLIKRMEPTSKAKFVAFETLSNSVQMPGQRRPVLEWPYVEALRMDEAMNPLSLLAVGLYGRVLPNQNGAPIRLVTPWKYGFKSIKSLVKITLTEQQPRTTWSIMASKEYGFYANVNPEVDHPRWSQAKERRIGDFFKRKTLPFNGYGEHVAHLYKGLDPAALY